MSIFELANIALRGYIVVTCSHSDESGNLVSDVKKRFIHSFILSEIKWQVAENTIAVVTETEIAFLKEADSRKFRQDCILSV